MDKAKIILVRSPRALIKDSLIGYGWKVDFTAYESAKDLIKNGFAEVNYGKRKKQISTYFNLKEGDIVVVPVSKAIAIGKVVGTKSFEPNSGIPMSQNRITVRFYSDANGNAFIPRSLLSTKFQTRLKIKMSVANLSEFFDEISAHIEALKQGQIRTLENAYSEKLEQEEIDFKSKLLRRIRTGKDIAIEAGGYGLEKLVLELLTIHGYSAKIQAKNQSSGIDDVDIIAEKSNDFTGKNEFLFVQVKHHKGKTDIKGIKQLAEHKVEGDVDYKKLLITSASLDENTKLYAEENSVLTMEGEALVELITNNIDKLSEDTKIRLGITVRPYLV